MSVKIPFKPLAKEEVSGLAFRPANHHGRKSHVTTGLDLPIVAVDSEGYNGDDKDHYLDLVAAAGNNWTDYKSTDNVRLTPEEIFDFLLSLPEKYGKALYFIYSGSYDASMWIKWLPPRLLLQINKTGKLKYKHYLIQWVMRREFIIYDLTSIQMRQIIKGKRAGKWEHWYDRKIRIYDVFGFFQMSFVKALEDWKITDQDTIDRIASMKGQRGKFSEVEKNKILEYCLEECQLLVKLGNEFRKACVKANIKPAHWYGAGALASTLMRQYGIKAHISEPEDEFQKAFIKRAYFGGRTEISYQGRLPHGGYQYDINSAYPTAMCNLPSLANGKWWLSRNSKTDFFKYEFSVWHVTWNCHGKLWGPFPWRGKNGDIFYPDAGEGYYHKIEIEAALTLYPDCEFDIQEGVIFEPSTNYKPFHFIAEKAAYRLQLKADGDPANKPLKLGLNSLYGKTAQTVGKKPPYQSFFWSGYTTATTRAKILDAIRFCNGTIYSVATDGLISSVEIDELSVGPNLGQWEKTKIIEGILIRPGVYKWLDDRGKYHYGTRGFQRDELLWETIENAWDNGNDVVPIKYIVTRFIGLRQAIARGDKWRDYFGKWVKQERSLNFFPKFFTREWDIPASVPRFGTYNASFIRLKLVCNCNGNNCVGASHMYVKLQPEESTDGIRYLIDEDQP